MLRKIVFAPGINKEGTQYSAGQSWWDCDKVRFRKGRPEAVGGWEKYTDASYKGVARSLFDWGTAAAKSYLGIGTNLKTYIETGGAIYDITPIRLTTSGGDVTFSATTGDATITVTDATVGGHGCSLGDYVTYTSATGLGGNISAAVLNQEYKVATVTSTSIYTIEAKDSNGDPVLATAGDTLNGGASTVAEYQINTGTNSYVASSGYGVGTYGSGVYGGGGSLSFAGQLRLYSQDEFGDDLIFNPRVGGIFFWDESAIPVERAKDISDTVAFPSSSNAPVTALQIMVSQVDKHVIAFGTNPIGSTDIDPLLVRWSDQEDAFNWTPSATNTAGGQQLSSGTEIIGAVKTRQEKLVFTDKSIHAMRYSGSPYVYQFSVISENIGMIAPNAAVAVGDSVFFMGRESFYIYSGSIKPIPCSVLRYVFSRMDVSQVYKIYAHHNPMNSEVTWHYPVGSMPAEITDYVTYNYADDNWTIGTFDRGAWIQGSTKTYPIASSNDTVNVETNYLYNQEFGFNAETSAINPYITSGIVDISSPDLGDGESMMYIDRMIPDFSIVGAEDSASFNVYILGNKYPQQALTVRSNSTVLYDTEVNYVRVRARGIALKIEGTGIDYGWRMGDFRFDLRTDGKQ